MVLKSFIDHEKIIPVILGYLPNVFAVIVLGFLFWVGNKLIQKTLQATLTRMKLEPQAKNLLLRAARDGIMVFAFLTIADQLQDNIKSLPEIPAAK